MRSPGIKAAAVLVVSATVLTGLGAALGAYFQAPDEAALRQPPVRVPITDELRSEILEDAVTFRGVFVAASRGHLRFATSLEGRVVTAVSLQSGGAIQFGKAAVEVEGRPIIVLSGLLPTWRDFDLTMTPGPDVAQLQVALTQLGLYDGRVSGKFDRRTLAAGRRLYQTIGYVSPRGDRLRQEEIVFVPPGLPLVGLVSVSVGDRLSAEAIELSSSTYRIDAGMSIDVRASLRPGAKIQLLLGSGPGWTSRLLDVRDLETSDGGPEGRVAISLADPAPAGLVGEQTFRVVRSTTVEPVLSAAAAAVHMSSNGRPYVVRLEAGTEETIEVTVGLVTANRVQIRAVAPMTLSPADLLVLNPLS